MTRTRLARTQTERMLLATHECDVGEERFAASIPVSYVKWKGVPTGRLSPLFLKYDFLHGPD